MYMRHITLVTLLASTACGPTPTTTSDAPRSGPPELGDITGQALAAQTLGPDPYEIGTSWYDYTQKTHVLTPRDHVYVLRRGGDERAIFEIKSYYNDEGESGFFRLRHRIKQQDGSWSEAEEVTTSENVKTANLCISPEMKEVPCNTDDAFLVFRIVRRALPDAGFAVRDPGIFLRTHFDDNPSQDELVFIEADALEDVDLEALATRSARPSSAADPVHSRVGWIHDRPDDAPRQDIHFQVTTSLHATLWSAQSITQDDATLSVTFKALCQRTNFASQRNFDPALAAEFTITLPTDTPYAGTQVQLCDEEEDTGISGAQSDSITQPYRGLWPESPPFDLFVEQVQGRVAIRLAPGNLLWNWTTSEAGQLMTPSFEDPLDPGAVWDTFY